MRALLVGPLARSLSPSDARGFDLTVAVDGGMRACLRARLRPDVAIGDWDSGPRPKPASGLEVITLARDKDSSDLHYAATLAVALGATALECHGFGGGRIDHELAALYELVRLADRASVTLYAPHSEIRLLARGRHALKLRRGQVASILPLGGPARGVTLRGFKFALSRAVLNCDSRGLSNVVLRARVEIELTRGCVALMLPGTA